MKAKANDIADLFLVARGDRELQLLEDLANRGSPLGLLTGDHHLGGRWLRRCLLAHLRVT